MVRHFHLALGLVLTLGVSGCTCGDATQEKAPSPSSSASAQPVVSAAPTRVPRPTHPVPEPEQISVITSDGFHIEASHWKSAETSAPLVILAHRLGGSRQEWMPLLERLLPSKTPIDVVAYDLRGHGASTVVKGKKERVTWHGFEAKDFEKMDGDLVALEAHLNKNNQVKSWTLVGSSLGATLVVRHAKKRDGKVAGVALVSPGASIRGLNLYQPFGAVLRLPNLLISATLDSISKDPVKAMQRMSKTSRILLFEGQGHGAEQLGERHGQMWDDLADWIDERVDEVAIEPTSATANSSHPLPSSSP
jgi:predicted esterase